MNYLKQALRTLSLTIIAILSITLAGKNLLDSLFGDLCKNEIVQKVPAPTGLKVAYVFTRDCGATTNPSLQLSILEKDEDDQNDSGNTFRSDKDFFIEWTDDKTLKVIYDKSSEVFEKDTKVNGISIEYNEK